MIPKYPFAKSSALCAMAKSSASPVLLPPVSDICPCGCFWTMNQNMWHDVKVGLGWLSIGTLSYIAIITPWIIRPLGEATEDKQWLEDKGREKLTGPENHLRTRHIEHATWRMNRPFYFRLFDTSMYCAYRQCERGDKRCPACRSNRWRNKQ